MAQEHAKNNDCRTTTVCCFDSPSPSSLLSIRHVQDLSETVSKAMSLDLPHHGPNIGARCGGWWSRDIIAAVLVGLTDHSRLAGEASPLLCGHVCPVLISLEIKAKTKT